MGLIFDNPVSVAIKQNRWDIDIILTREDGLVVHLVASADSAYADSGIWFGTKEEHDEIAY